MTKPLLQFMRKALARLTHPGRASHGEPAGAQAQAAAVRAMAYALRASDPGFARELYAVAYHHELQASRVR